MKILDKLKNALFEEEYVEVEEKPKKKKNIKKEEIKRTKINDIRDEEPKPIAKKIVLPEREEVKITDHNDYEDLKVDVVEENINKEKNFPIISDNEFIVEEPNIEIEDNNYDVKEENPHISREIYKEQKQEKKEYSKPTIEEKHQPKLYGMDQIPIPEPEYGTYEKEDRTYFKPSPIISPIYGILDKNYKKEDIAPKREIRITSSYSKENLDLDEVRKKAYGLIEKKEEKIEYETDFEEDESNIMDQELVDLTENETPKIKKVTIEDAEEYFNDLGLEYNIDYKDSQKERIKPKEEQKLSNEYIAPVVDKEEYEAKLKQETKQETKQEDNDIEEDEDNLFDLIDSMYEKE